MEEGKHLMAWSKGNKAKIALMAMAGVFLLVASIPTGKEQQNQEGIRGLGTYGSSGSDSLSGLEEKMSLALSQIEGLGETHVVLTGSGESSMMEKDGQQTITGVLVITENGESKQAVERITTVMEALFDVPAHKIIVAKMNQEELE
jgi:hypothetical protein